MPTDPPTPPPDTKDWTWVLDTPCPDCAFDARAITFNDIPRLTNDSVATLRSALAGEDPTRRPAPETWSPLEYACHVRDVCRIFGARLSLLRTSTDPLFADWDQDATALEDRYWTQVPATVSSELDDEGTRIAADFDTVRGDELARPGRRSNGSVFTVDTLGRYFIHDLVHHAHDVS